MEERAVDLRTRFVLVVHTELLLDLTAGLFIPQLPISRNNSESACFNSPQLANPRPNHNTGICWYRVLDRFLHLVNCEHILPILANLVNQPRSCIHSVRIDSSRSIKGNALGHSFGGFNNLRNRIQFPACASRQVDFYEFLSDGSLQEPAALDLSDDSWSNGDVRIILGQYSKKTHAQTEGRSFYHLIIDGLDLGLTFLLREFRKKCRRISTTGELC